jgi:hypothetical protein
MQPRKVRNLKDKKKKLLTCDIIHIHTTQKSEKLKGKNHLDVIHIHMQLKKMRIP